MLVIEGSHLPTLHGSWEWGISLDYNGHVVIEIKKFDYQDFSWIVGMSKSKFLTKDNMSSLDNLIATIRAGAEPMADMYAPWNPYAVTLLNEAGKALIPPADRK